MLQGHGCYFDIFVGNWSSEALLYHQSHKLKSCADSQDWIIVADSDEFHAYPGRRVQPFLNSLDAQGYNYVNGIFQIFDADKSGCLDVGKFWQLLALLQSSQGADGAQTEAVDVSTDMMETNTLVPNQRGTPVRSLPAEASPVRPTALTVNPVPNHCGCMLNGAIWPGSLDACCRIVRHRSPSVAIASLIADKR